LTADFDHLATATLASLQGGLLLAKTTRSREPLRIALDAALDHLRAHAPSVNSAEHTVAVDPMAVLVDHGMLLESAHRPLPNLAELVAGERIRGSWWGHPPSHRWIASTLRGPPGRRAPASPKACG